MNYIDCFKRIFGYIVVILFELSFLKGGHSQFDLGCHLFAYIDQTKYDTLKPDEGALWTFNRVRETWPSPRLQYCWLSFWSLRTKDCQCVERSLLINAILPSEKSSSFPITLNLDWQQCTYSCDAPTLPSLIAVPPTDFSISRWFATSIDYIRY
jgi:hypothetical protein